MTQIKFGTDGWRGLIADDFTFDNVRRVAGAIAGYVLKHEDPTHGVIIGYDTRFLSDRAARAVAEVIAAAGIPVLLANDYVPTPTVSYNVKKLGAAGGVMVTSSHNPWNWNGVKFKAKFGGSATPAIMKSIEDELGQMQSCSDHGKLPSFAQPGTGGGARPHKRAGTREDRRGGSEARLCRGRFGVRRSRSHPPREFQICHRLHVRLRSRRASENI